MSSTSTSTNNLPDSMTGPPTLSLVAPGKCQFTDEFASVPLLKRFDVSSTSSVLRFGLPNSKQPLDLSTCACILAKSDLINKDSGETEVVVRPYTPISTNKQVGCFDLLVKNYGANGYMSRHLNEMPVGESVEFKHIGPNVKIQAPFRASHIGMIVGGTGITPMVQALHAILGDASDETKKVTMLYGSKESNDILGKEMLDAWEHDFPGRLKVIHVLSNEPDDSDWKGERGYIDADKIKANFPEPNGEETVVFVCGPPPMYNALSGPRQEKELTGALGNLGYTAEQVYKF